MTLRYVFGVRCLLIPFKWLVYLRPSQEHACSLVGLPYLIYKASLFLKGPFIPGCLMSINWQDPQSGSKPLGFHGLWSRRAIVTCVLFILTHDHETVFSFGSLFYSRLLEVWGPLFVSLMLGSSLLTDPYQSISCYLGFLFLWKPRYSNLVFLRYSFLAQYKRTLLIAD